LLVYSINCELLKSVSLPFKKGFKNTLSELTKSKLENAFSKAEVATSKSRFWIRDTGANILKITIPLEKEVASGALFGLF
jgi:hypothetical protein